MFYSGVKSPVVVDTNGANNGKERDKTLKAKMRPGHGRDGFLCEREVKRFKRRGHWKTQGGGHGFA